MPSPIAHTTMGYVIHKAYQARRPGQGLGQFGRLPRLLILTSALSLLPDIDSIAGLLLRDFGRYHNSVSHSLVVGLVVALVIGVLAWATMRAGFLDWFVLALLCYELHIVLDFFTGMRGVMLFWPFSSARFQSPVKLFYGLHWSDGIVSINHLWTLLNEVVFAALVVLTLHFDWRRLISVRGIGGSSNPPGVKASEEN